MSSSWKLESSQTTQASGSTSSDELAQRRADVPGRPRAEHRAEQLRRRRLPVRAGDADERVRQQPARRARSRSRPGSRVRAPRRRAAPRPARPGSSRARRRRRAGRRPCRCRAIRSAATTCRVALRLERRLRRQPGAREPEHERLRRARPLARGGSRCSSGSRGRSRRRRGSRPTIQKRHHDLRLRPRLHLEVMVDRRHQEDAAFPVLEADDLDDHRERLDRRRCRRSGSAAPRCR